MKILKNIIIWSLIAFAIESGAMFYLNKRFFVTTGSFKEVKVVKHDSAQTKKITISTDAKKLDSSYDGRFVSYISNNALTVTDTEKVVTKTVGMEAGYTLDYCKWITDDERLIICEKSTKGDKNTFEFYSYDAVKNEKAAIIDFYKKVLKIDVNGKSSTVGAIAFSTDASTLYIKINKAGKKSDLYKINVMNEMQNKNGAALIVGNIAVLPLSDDLVYEDALHKKVRDTSKAKNIVINSVNTPCLLGTDTNDNVYIGDRNENKVSAVYFGNLTTSTDKWTKLQLSEPTETDNLIITPNGKIFVNDALNGNLVDLQAGTKTKYQGTLIKCYDGGAISLIQGEIKKVTIK